MKLLKPEAITVRKGGSADWKILTDHNRSQISVASEIIERKQRMVNGTMRRYHVATKHSWSWSWDMLPTNAAAVVGEGGSLPVYGAADIKQFVDEVNSSGSCNTDFYMRLYSGQHPRPEDAGTHPPEIRVIVSEFNYDIVKRGAQYQPGVEFDFWNVNITMEEV